VDLRGPDVRLQGFIVRDADRIVRDADRQALGYVYFEGELG
jgi:hypothetical protein